MMKLKMTKRLVKKITFLLSASFFSCSIFSCFAASLIRSWWLWGKSEGLPCKCEFMICYILLKWWYATTNDDMNDDKSERHHYTKHLSEFLFPFWSHELLLLWLLEFIAELLKPEMNFAQICINFFFNFNTFAFEEPASASPSSDSPPAPPSSRCHLRIPEKDWI